MTTKKQPIGKESGVMFLSPLHENLEVKGKLSYSEGDQAWTTLRLKKDILKKFPYLKDKQGSFVYCMKVYTSHKDLKKEVEQMEKDSGMIPMIFMIGKENKEPNN